jgi:hypothetical protein
MAHDFKAFTLHAPITSFYFPAILAEILLILLEFFTS